MKECPKCHTRYDDNMNFCLKDGCKLTEIKSEPEKEGPVKPDKHAETDKSAGREKRGKAVAGKKKGGWLKNVLVVLVVLAVAGFGIYSYIMNSATYINLEPEEIIVPKCGGEYHVDVDYDGYNWKIVHCPDWAYTTNKSDNSVRLTVKKNKTGQNREGKLTARSGKQSGEAGIYQAGYATKLLLGTSRVHFRKGGGRESISINTDGCEWRYTGPDWIKMGVAGKDSIWIKCERNESYYRTYTVTVSEDNVSAAITIEQGGICGVCGGKGETVCNSCFGNGGSYFGMYYNPCFSCGGSGKLQCSACNGYGEIK